MSAKRVMLDNESLYLFSMGRRLRVLAIFTDDAEANDYMDKHDNAAVVANFPPFVFLADRYDKGAKP